MRNKDTTGVINRINSFGPTIVRNVTKAINKKIKKVGELDDYKIVWKQLQDIAVKEIVTILKTNFRGCIITITESKSTYPDIKMKYKGGKFAIDIKSNESQKDPWFDMARLDTVEKKRINSYDEEWELVIKYDSETKKFLKAYFNLFREIVGKRNECDGVKYRPYDGKLRPKNWDDFENNKIYWHTKEDFLKGIRNSKIHRWKELIKKTLIPILTSKEKNRIKKLFD